MWTPQDPEERARLERIERQWQRALPRLIRTERRNQPREVTT